MADVKMYHKVGNTMCIFRNFKVLVASVRGLKLFGPVDLYR